MASSPPVWFITGCSAGFGFALAEHAIYAGHRVVATLRSRTKSHEAVKSLENNGAKVLELDVTDQRSIKPVVERAVAQYGQIDVLVNNAGYSLLGAIEDMTDAENHLQFETNFFGPVRLLQNFLPHFRARRTGTVVNVSSVAGIDGLPSCGMYAGSKFALEGLSESLAAEMEPFGVNVLIVEPGTFRTNFLAAVAVTEKGITPPYKGGPIDAVLAKFDEIRGKQKGNPKEGAARIFEAVTGTGKAGHLKGKVRRLLLGQDCVDRADAKVESLKNDVDACREVAASTAFAE